MKRSLVRAASLALAAALAVALAGCSAAPATTTPSPTASPSPTFFCTPDAGGAPTPCSPEAYTEQLRLDVLYAEATKNYQRFFNESVKLQRAGGTDKATPTMLAVAAGPYLDAQVTNLRRFAELGIKAGPGDIKLVRVDRSPGAASRGYEVALATCIDSRGVPLLQGDTTIDVGTAYAETVYFKRDVGVLKLWDGEGKRVDGC